VNNDPWVDFEPVSLEMVLNHYRLEFRSAGSRTLRGRCPLPTHGSTESKASFSAALTKGVGGIWARQSASCVKARDGQRGGNALDFVAAMESCTIREAAQKIAVWFGVRAEDARADSHKSAEKPKLVSEETSAGAESGNKPLTFTLQGMQHQHPYLQSRGVDEAMARAFGIGYFPGRGSMNGRIVFQIRNEQGELVAYAGRAIDEGQGEPRYKFPPGFRKGAELYNIHRAIEGGNQRKRVVIVEGFFQCLRVCAAGFPCVALMGSSMSEAQEEKIVRLFDVACILLDGDAAGQQGSMDCLTRLGRRMWAWAPVLPAGKQPDTFSVEEIQALVKK
jgi:DNA primase